MYPRPNKYGHAACFGLIQRALIDSEIQRPAAAIVTNFSPPENDKPSLLHHREVVTFFHEFGHAMHNMCSEGNFQKLSGTHVERDFVEMPSQMLENWIWDKEILKQVSKHYQSNQPLPDDIIDRKIASKNQFVAKTTLASLKMSTFDFLIHSYLDPLLLKSSSSGLAKWRKEIPLNKN